MDINKKIRDTFNPPPSLEGEDWLVPSSNVWDEIEKDIASKKKKRFGFFIFLGLLLLALVFSLLYLFSASSNSSDLKEPADSTSYLSSPISGIENKADTENRDEINSNGLVSSDETGFRDATSRTKAIELEQSSYLAKQQLSSQEQKAQKQDISSSKPSSKISFTTTLSENKSNDVSLRLVSTNEMTNNITVNKNLEKDTNPRDDVMQRKGAIIQTSTLSISGLSLVDFTSEGLDAVLKNPYQIPQNKNFGKQVNAIVFSAGASFWNINMNDNYLSALEPANFDASNGSGYYFNLGYKKYLSSRFFAQADFKFEHVEFISGHNSVVEYSLANENGLQQNNFDITMASPMGFLESNIEIERRSTDVSETESLTIDLHNSHRIGSINGLLQIGYELLKLEKWNASIAGGIGYNYFVYNDNTLDRFDITNDNFESVGSVILATQESINKLRPYFSFSSSLHYSLTGKTSLFLKYSFSQDLINVYQFEDFSTRISRQNIGIGLQLRF